MGFLWYEQNNKKIAYWICYVYLDDYLPIFKLAFHVFNTPYT